LARTGVPGGGAPSRTAIARAMFSRDLADLSSVEKRHVRNAEAQQFRWLNRHGVQAVFSRSCTKMVPNSSSPQAQTCLACHSVAALKIFKNALRVPPPLPENQKFVPHSYREKELGELYLRYHGLSDLVKKVRYHSFSCMLGDFARGVLNGQYKDQEVLLGAVQATITTKQREAKGKQMRNMIYPAAFD
ncbi:hypothetical protein EXIGLDRAFT_579866, partial [Exidia glandulosa HHB12029]